jgi:hypothetical protein
MRLRFLAIAGGVLLASAARAAAPQADLPPLRLHYVSALAGYPTHADATPIDWSRSNALVGKLRGHAGHERGVPTEHPPPRAAQQADGVRP